MRRQPGAAADQRSGHAKIAAHPLRRRGFLADTNYDWDTKIPGVQTVTYGGVSYYLHAVTTSTNDWSIILLGVDASTLTESDFEFLG